MVIKRAYPDTPVAMHYRPFKEIDWCKLLQADEVVLVITPVFLREIDDHKDHKRGVLQQRARRMNSWLADMRRTENREIRRGVRVEVNAREPEVDVDFAAHGLHPSVNDDKIVACMIRDAGVHSGVPLICVTSDNALGYKVEGAGFEVAEPPENLRLGDEPDPFEREKRELQKEIVELKKRLDPEPDLTVRFDGGEERLITVRLAGLERPAETDLDVEIEVERRSLERRDRFLPTLMKRPPSAKEVERHLAELRAWMVASTKAALERAHTFELRLVLANSGTGNASNIEVDLTFPNAVFAGAARRLRKVADRPAPPKAEDILAVLKIAELRPFPYPRLDLGRVRLREPVRIDEDIVDAHRLRVLLDLAKHQSSVVLPSFQAWFQVGQRPEGFSIDYRIHAASTPNIKTGRLHVRVEVGEGPFRFFRSKLGKPDVEEEEKVSREELDEMLDGAIGVAVADDD